MKYTPCSYPSQNEGIRPQKMEPFFSKGKNKSFDPPIHFQGICHFAGGGVTILFLLSPLFEKNIMFQTFIIPA